MSAMRNWIGNFKLFFGLFHLGVKSLGPIVLGGIIVLMIMGSKLGGPNLRNTKKGKIKLTMIKRGLMHFTELGVINIIFIGLIGFSSLSSVFAELSTYKL